MMMVHTAVTNDLSCTQVTAHKPAVAADAALVSGVAPFAAAWLTAAPAPSSTSTTAAWPSSHFISQVDRIIEATDHPGALDAFCRCGAVRDRAQHSCFASGSAASSLALSGV